MPPSGPTRGRRAAREPHAAVAPVAADPQFGEFVAPEASPAEIDASPRGPTRAPRGPNSARGGDRGTDWGSASPIVLKMPRAYAVPANSVVSISITIC
jgi:hypothetical protein